MSHLAPRRRRAPQDDGAALIDPPLNEVPKLIERNRKIALHFDQVSGISFKHRLLARIAALPHTDTPKTDAQMFADAERNIVLTGHQPELFHPGVWFKNFLASALARGLNGLAINLVVDNDEVSSTTIRVPTRAGNLVQVVELPFDVPSSARPWENRRILDFEQFRNFATEVHRAIDPVINGRHEFRTGMILDRFWAHAVEEMESQRIRSLELDKKLATGGEFPTVSLSRTISSARRRMEADLGMSIHDFPVRRLGFDIVFGEFVGLLISRHREFHAIHNAALHEYRRLNRIRSSSHPFPELTATDEWFEFPLWVWTAPQSQRRRVFVREAKGHFELSDRQDIHIQLPHDASDYGLAFINSRIHLRPRALITTMYARLVLSDLFIHGIGGAKYDELTDLIIRRFFGIEPPAYVTATATFRLPIDRPNVSLDDVRTCARRIRELRFRPESFLRAPLVRDDAHLAPKLSALAAEKRDFLDRHDLRRCSQQVFDQLDSLNRAMHNLLQPVEQSLRAEHSDLITEANRAQLLSSREFSFVLFPSEILPARLLALSQTSS